METFDYIIIGLGFSLIAIGLILFISGKRDSQKNNQVEGFGIKLNVSNPSIILIVFGIGLVLFPRLMPNNSEQQKQISEINGNNNVAVENIDPNPVKTPQKTIDQSIQNSNVFFPKGTWYLTQYQENGVDLSGNVQGNINFNQTDNSTLSWRANMTAVDAWGNQLNYYYSGLINALPGGYNLDTQNSNDPAFNRSQPSLLVLKLDNPNSLHMEYFFNGSALILHWRQN